MILRLGSYLQDRYEIIELIGSGGMAEVYRAFCHKMQRTVAIKVLKEEYNDNADFIKRFTQEALAAAQLSHPNLVNVYEVEHTDGFYYIVMEFVDGITLKEYIHQKGKLEQREAVGIAIQVANGLAEVHRRGIVHRDVKPQNMIISSDGKTGRLRHCAHGLHGNHVAGGHGFRPLYFAGTRPGKGDRCAQRPLLPRYLSL